MTFKRLARLPEFGRYFMISVVALAVDVGALMLVAQVLHYLWAATVGFIAGSLVSYGLAVRWVFPVRRLSAYPRAEFLAYALVGVIGLGVNNAIIALAVEGMDLPLLAGKMAAAAATFMSNYGVRKWMLFRK